MSNNQFDKDHMELSEDFLENVSGGMDFSSGRKVGGTVTVTCSKCGKSYTYNAGTAPQYHKCPECGTIN